MDYEPGKLLRFLRTLQTKLWCGGIAARTITNAKTKYHIHLIFRKRKLLDDPVVKIATREHVLVMKQHASHQKRYRMKTVLPSGLQNHA